MNFKNLKFTHISSISQPAVRRGSASATAPEFLLFIDRIFILFAVFDNVTALLEQYECISVGIFSKSLF